MARRRKPEESHENFERWFVSYADFITLLFAFFTVMYALSTVNEQKYKAMSDSLSDAFSSEVSESPQDQAALPAYREDPTLGYMTSSFKKTFSGDYRRVQSNLSELETQKKITINIERRGVVVSLLEQGVFSSGDATLLTDSLAVIDEIAATLKDLPNQIKIEGHSDNVPIHNDEFASNWELSSARALNILLYIVNTHSMDPTKYSATGYGEFRPIADNDTPVGRSKNRRVDIVLFDRDAAFIEPI